MDDEVQNSFPGSCPEFGAIFMSNNATKKECLRRQVFALPFSQSQFVKQVKAGMILFLFEFERRELHGVFQASSDGAMNILPHAFSSSGKKFPAQVKFTPLWHCHPLCENEFRNAIKENYFSRNKFNFGLSEDQVQRLLSLFSFKRLKDRAPQKHLTRSKVASPTEYTTSKNIRLVDSSPISNQVVGECDVDNHHGPVISTMHRGDSFYDDDRASADGRFGTFNDVGYRHKASAFLIDCFKDLTGQIGGNVYAGENATNDGMDSDWNTDIKLQPAVSVRHSSGNFRSISNDDRFAKNDRMERKCHKNDSFLPTISTGYPHPFQSKVNPQAYSSKCVLQTDSFLDDPTRPSSTFLPSMEMQNSNVSYPLISEDSIVTTNLPYDHDVPSTNYRGSSILGFNQGHAPLQGYPCHDSFDGNVLGSSTNQSFPSLLERSTAINPDVNSDFRDFSPFPYSNQYERSNRSLPRHDHLDDLAAPYSNTECCGDLSLPKHSLAPALSSEVRNNVRISEHSSSYRTCPSKFPSFAFSDRYPALLQDKHDYQEPEHENHAEFDNGGFMFKESKHNGDSFYNDNREIVDGRFAIYKNLEYENREGQHQLHVYEPIKVDYHEVTSLTPAAYQNSECLNPESLKKKGSVFTRLAVPPKACEQENNNPPGTADINRHTSVNEVMDMLHQSRYHWVKTRCKQLVKHQDDAVIVSEEKQVTRKSSLAMIAKEMNVKPTSFSKENSSQKTEETTFVDFKRRSAVIKNLEDGKTRKHCEILNNKRASAAQCKKRKLIRPDFSVNESSDRDIAGDTSEYLTASSMECYVSKTAESNKVAVCHVNENNMSQKFKLPNLICQTALVGNSIDMGSGSNSEKFSMVSVVALRNAEEDGKESSKNHGLSGMAPGSGQDMHIESEKDLTTSDIGMDGLSENRNDVSHSTHHSSPKICEDSDGNGVAKSDFVNSIKQNNDLCPVDGEISISNEI